MLRNIILLSTLVFLTIALVAAQDLIGVQDDVSKFEDSIVVVFKDSCSKGGIVLGTGFLVNSYGLVVTADHVIASQDGEFRVARPLLATPECYKVNIQKRLKYKSQKRDWYFVSRFQDSIHFLWLFPANRCPGK